MANKWAIQNGNWSDGSTWNDGVVPTDDDDVWLNGYVLASAYSRTCKSLHNTGVGYNEGGHITVSSATVTFTCEIFIGNESMFWCSYSQMTYVGDIHLLGSGFLQQGKTGLRTVDILGNVDSVSSYIVEASTGVTITGNVYAPNGTIAPSSCRVVGNCDMRSCYYQNGVSCEIDGNFELLGATSVSILIARANLILRGKLTVGTITIYGRLDYYNVDANDLNLATATLNLPNYDSFTANNLSITQPDYPSVADVKKGVKYGYNEYIGVYEAVADYPQEANVLKGISYAGGDKVGTLEVIALSGATAQAEDIAVVNLTEQQLQRVGNCATVSTVQKCFEEFKE
jgi:hypothetical protein